MCSIIFFICSIFAFNYMYVYMICIVFIKCIMCIIIHFDNINYYMCKIICKRIITVTIFIVFNNAKCYCYWSLLNVSSLPYVYNICIIYTFPMNKTTSSHKVLARPDLPILSGVWSSSGTSKGIHAPLRLDVFLRMFVGGGRRIFP